MEKDTSDPMDPAAQETYGLAREIWLFLSYNKKWWLVPIIVLLALIGVLLLLGGASPGPFLYTLF